VRVLVASCGPVRARAVAVRRTLEETKSLVKGVEICGGGKWAEIKKLGDKTIQKRSAVDLKDKWRNLMRVALSSSR
jgi:Myb-like DNA-binding domain